MRDRTREGAIDALKMAQAYLYGAMKGVLAENLSTTERTNLLRVSSEATIALSGLEGYISCINASDSDKPNTNNVGTNK